MYVDNETRCRSDTDRDSMHFFFLGKLVQLVGYSPVSVWPRNPLEHACMSCMVACALQKLSAPDRNHRNDHAW